MAPTRRAQILMEPEEFRRLQALARERRTSVANLIRSAVRDTYLAPQTAKPGLGAPSRRTESGPCGSFLIRVSFLYAAGQAHPRRDACVKVLRRVAEGTLEATANSEVIQEILYVLVRRCRVPGPSPGDRRGHASCV